MSDDKVSLTGDRLARVVCAFQQLKPMEEQFTALGILAEVIMKDWPPHICLAMLASLELRLGLSDLFDQQTTVDVMPN